MTNLTAEAALAINNLTPGKQVHQIGSLLRQANHAGKRFHELATLTSAAAATPVSLIPAADVESGEKVYVEGFLLSVNGTTAWATTGTEVWLRDRHGTPVKGAIVAVAQLTANAQLGFLSTGVTLHADVRTGVGLTGGLEIVGDANFGAGDDITIQVWGQIE